MEISSADSRPRKQPEAWRLAVAVTVLLACPALYLSAGLGDLSGDSARYLLLARAIAEGRGYVELEKPGAPPHSEYAPGLPLLLAPIMAAAPHALIAPKLVIYLALAALALLTHALARAAGIGPRPAAALALILASAPALSRFANQVLSDLPYAAVSTLALWLAVALYRSETRPSPARLFGLGLVAAAAFLFRQMGLALWAALAAAALCDRRRPGRDRLVIAGWVTLGFALPAGAWLARNYLATGALDADHAAKLLMARDADPFAGQLDAAGLLQRALGGPWAYFQSSATLILDMAFALAPRPLRLAAAGLLAAPVLVGLVLGLIRRRGPLELYFIFYFAIICAWQSHNPRYLIPLAPVALVLAASGLASGDRSRHGFRRWGPRALVALAIAANLIALAADQVLIRRSPLTPAIGPAASPQDVLLADLAGPIKWGYWYQYPDWLERDHPAAIARGYHCSLAAAVWIGRELPASALVMARKPRLVAYLSDRHVLQYPAEPDPEKLLAELEAQGVTHLLAEQSAPAVWIYIQRLIEQKPEALKPVFTLESAVVYEVQRRK